MDYNIILELDNVRLDDCFELYYKKNIVTVINDGRIINFEKCEGETNEYKNKKTKRKCYYTNKR